MRRFLQARIARTNQPAEDLNRGRSASTLDDDICVHIFSSSAVMVGVCLTVVGLLRVVVTLKKEDVLGDDLLAVNTMLYLGAVFLSYLALRSRKRGRKMHIERAADGLFLVALTFTVVVTGFITWAMSIGP